MSNRVDLEPAFVLHTRPYRNSSLIVELFTMRYGRVGVMARSARGPRSRYRGILQPFSPLLVSWTGRSNLKNLGNVELCGLSYQLDGTALLCGFYLNELLMRLVKHDDPYLKLYERYQTTLNALESGHQVQVQLRYFEKNLLSELGYGIPLLHDVTSGCEISAAGFYRYVPERGFVQCGQGDQALVFPGSLLLALYHETLVEHGDLNLVKQLMRLVLSRYIGEKPLGVKAVITFDLGLFSSS